jgi:hypothetical protein
VTRFKVGCGRGRGPAGLLDLEVGCGVCREGARKGVAGLLDLKMKIEDIPAGVKIDIFC